MNWRSEPLRGQPPAAIVVLTPIGHQGIAQKLRLTSTSTAIARLAPGRYQLTTTAPLIVDRQAYGWNIELALVDPVNNIRLSQENAVRLEVGDVIEPAARHVLPANAPAAPTHTRAEINPESQIVALLNRWAASLRARDLRTHMSCYAPQLARYYQQRNVSWRQVEAQKRKLLQLYTQLRSLELRDINVTIDGEQAAATAVRKWDFTNHEVESRGTVLVNFEFTQIGSRWVITSEWQGPVPESPDSVSAR